MNGGSKSETTLKERFREATRLAILDAAEGAFAAQGFDGARMDAIAATAGVSVGTVYNHLGDRQQLLVALLDSRRAEVVARLDEVLREGEAGPFMPLLERFVRVLLGHFDAHRALFQLVMEEEASRLRSHVRGKSVMRELVDRAERLVRVGVDKGVLRADDAAHFSVFLIGSMRGILVRGISRRGGEPFEQLVPMVMRFFLAGAEQ